MDNKAVCEALAKAATAAIFLHVRPDGDAIGSSLALAAGLRQLGKKADVYCDDALPEKYGFLPGAESVGRPALSGYDVLVAVDCGDAERMGGYGESFLRGKNTVCIDHHRTNAGFAKFNLIEKDAAATAVIMLGVLKTLGVTVTREIAECLYTGISTDTGNFSHSNTDAAVFAAAAELAATGVDVNRIATLLYHNSSPARVKLLGRALSGMRFYENGTISVLTVTREDIAACGASASDTEGFIDHGIGIEGVEVALCLLAHGENGYKVSFRSKGKADVCAAAASFGGGGHTRASGCQIAGDYYEVLERLLKAVKDELYA